MQLKVEQAVFIFGYVFLACRNTFWICTIWFRCASFDWFYSSINAKYHKPTQWIIKCLVTYSIRSQNANNRYSVEATERKSVGAL